MAFIFLLLVVELADMGRKPFKNLAVVLHQMFKLLPDVDKKKKTSQCLLSLPKMTSYESPNMDVLFLCVSSYLGKWLSFLL